jgi:hypothetical protein
MSANKLPVADDGSFCGKRKEVCSGRWIRQADVKGNGSGGIRFPAAGQEQRDILIIAGLAFDFQINRFK